MVNELQIEKFKMFWEVNLTRFPMNYPPPSLDTRKAFKYFSESSAAHRISGVAHTILQHRDFQ